MRKVTFSCIYGNYKPRNVTRDLPWVLHEWRVVRNLYYMCDVFILSCQRRSTVTPTDQLAHPQIINLPSGILSIAYYWEQWFQYIMASWLVVPPVGHLGSKGLRLFMVFLPYCCGAHFVKWHRRKPTKHNSYWILSCI